MEGISSIHQARNLRADMLTVRIRAAEINYNIKHANQTAFFFGRPPPVPPQCWRQSVKQSWKQEKGNTVQKRGHRAGCSAMPWQTVTQTPIYWSMILACGPELWWVHFQSLSVNKTQKKLCSALRLSLALVMLATGLDQDVLFGCLALTEPTHTHTHTPWVLLSCESAVLKWNPSQW